MLAFNTCFQWQRAPLQRGSLLVVMEVAKELAGDTAARCAAAAVALSVAGAGNGQGGQVIMCSPPQRHSHLYALPTPASFTSF